MYIYIYIYIYIYPTLPLQAGCDTRSIFKQDKSGLNLTCSSPRLIALPRAKKSSLCYYLAIAKRITDGFMPFSRALVQNKMQTATLIFSNSDCHTKRASRWKDNNWDTKNATQGLWAVLEPNISFRLLFVHDIFENLQGIKETTLKETVETRCYGK